MASNNRYQDDELRREARNDAARSGAAMGGMQNAVLRTPIGGNAMGSAQNAVLRTPTSGTGIAPAGLAGAQNVMGTGTGTAKTKLDLSQRPMIAQQGQSGNLVEGPYVPPAPAAQLGVNAQLAEDIASGKIAGNDAVNAYGKLAAGKMDELQSMGKFNYDFNKDPLFKILSQSYMQQAQQAANNASAMAAARSGGYGNSYGAAAASQQYNQALGNLYDQVPELQQAAYERYLNDRNDLYKQAGYYNDRGDVAYDRAWNEDERKYNRAWNEDDRAYTRAWNEDDRSYNRAWDEENRDYTRAWDEENRDYTRAWNEDDRAFSRAWDEENRDYSRAWDEDERKYNRSWNEDERNYDRTVDAYNRGMEAAQYAGSLGNYELIEQLLGLDMSGVRNDDALNRAMSIIKATGMDSEQALDFLRRYVGVDFGSLIAGSSGSGGGSSSGGGGGRRSSGGSYSGGTPTNTGTPTTTSTPVAETSMPGVYDVTEIWDLINSNRRR